MTKSWKILRDALKGYKETLRVHEEKIIDLQAAVNKAQAAYKRDAVFLLERLREAAKVPDGVARVEIRGEKFVELKE